jgi:thiosulfate/3-mercaptopyruvate sulfurtransferase
MSGWQGETASAFRRKINYDRRIMKGYANAQLLITPAELSSLIERGGGDRPLVLDMRPPDAYTAGHVPGAVHLDLWGFSLIDTDPAPLKSFMWMIEHVLALHGVDGRTPIVVYDEQSGVRAARAFWFLEYFGHPSVRMLDGGFGAWTNAGLPVTRDAAPAPPTDWTGIREARAVATWKDVRDALHTPGTVILDTRSDGEYCGTTVRARRGGAIPGAVHVEWTRNLTSSPPRTCSGCMKRRASRPTATSSRIARAATARPTRTSHFACSATRRCAITSDRGRSGAIGRICRSRCRRGRRSAALQGCPPGGKS